MEVKTEAESTYSNLLNRHMQGPDRLILEAAGEGGANFYIN